MLKKIHLEDLSRTQSKKHVLDVLERESKEWMSGKDNTEILNTLVIPNVYYKQSDYYMKLQEVCLTENS